jgi:hypothetical protein
MFDVWTANLQTDEEKERFQNSLKGSKVVLDRLDQILTNKEMDLDRSTKSIKQYQTPNWGFETAHKNGYASALTQIRDLINLDHQRPLT